MIGPSPRMTVISNFRKFGTIALLALAGCQYALADDDYWAQYGNLPVPIQQGAQTLTFVDFHDGMLVAELDGGFGEVSMPVNESMVQSLRLDIGVMRKAKEMIDTGNYEGALTLMRPKVYPLIKFHQVPELFTQLHVPVRALLNTLISAEKYEEANSLLKRIRLDKSSIQYSEIGIRLMNAYISSKNFTAAAHIAQTLPVQAEYRPNIRFLIDAADALRAAEQYEAVIPLYRAIENAVSSEVQINVRMWLAYCLVLADRIEEASPMIDSMVEPNPKDQLFSLYKLLQGSREYRQKNYAQALDLLTRGFVRAQTSYIWVPEMLYLIGDCYARSKDLAAARNVWTEVTMLYPESPWAPRAETSLAQLPKPEPEQAEN